MRTRAALLAACSLIAPIACERPAAVPPPLPATVDGLDPAVASLLRSRRQVVVADPTGAGGWRDLALALEANELFDPARVCAEEAVRRDPDNPRAWYQLGRLATRGGNLERGRAAFAAASRLAPDYAPAVWQAGRIDLERGRFAEAAAAFERALAIDRTDAAAWTGLARAWLGLERPDLAATLLQVNVVDAEESVRPYALHLLAAANRRLGRGVEVPPAAAAPQWHDPWTGELDRHRPGYGARIEAARRDLDAGHIEAALATLRHLRSESPDNPVVAATLARAEREAGRDEAALALLEEILRTRPGFFPAHFEMAVTLARRSTAAPPEEAVTMRARADAAVTRVLELNPSYAPAHALRGDLATVNGQLDAAYGHYLDARRCDRTDPRWPQRCGIAALRRGDWSGAERWLDQAIAMQPADADAHRGRAIALMSQRRFDAAADSLARAAALLPDDPEIERTQQRLRSLIRGSAP